MQIRKAAVIGGGAMGGGIAHVLSSVGIECFIKDIDKKFVDKALSTSKAVYDKLVARGKLDPKKAEDCQGLLRGGVAYDRKFMAEADLVIEAVPEVMKLKQSVFAEIEKLCPETTILATNTSTLSLTEIADKVSKKDRFIGLHFFNPVPVMKLLEVIYDENTSKETVDAVMEFSLFIDKVPIKVKNGPGFAVNRVLIPYMNEAVLALMDGEATMEEIDEAMVAFGMPMGPFALWDMVGLDVGMHASETLAAAFAERTPVPELLKAIVKKGMLGQKTGKGFYTYTGKEKKPSREVDAFLKAWWKKTGISGLTFSPERLMTVQIRESLLIVSEGLASAHDVDTGMVYGTNFPTKVAWGPLHFAEDEVGWNDLSDILCALEAEYGPERFHPPAILEGLSDGRSVFENCFYEVDSHGVAVMYVENPPMNVLSVKTLNDIANTVLAACADNRVRVILLTGKGKAFVAGANIAEIQRLNGIHDAETYAQGGHLVMNTIDGALKPVICVINGFCLGGGLELAMACHMRIASDKARLGLPEINLGIMPGFGGTQRLPRIVGKGKALEMILTGGHITAAEALACGLVNRVVPQVKLMEEAHTLAGTIAAKSRLAVSAAIDAASEGLDVDLEEGIDIEVDNFARVVVSRDGKEGTDAFQNKRKPVFRDM
ncbi:MAG TPA: enoyl-CoA hydratase-related protein [Deltaproteobacteria bacterium]|nr:enoyl-CoA hydratase-related protein [Deltaproteobacteria bacterium]